MDDSLVAAAAQLEERDNELAAALDGVDTLARRAARVHQRAGALESFLAGIPAELAALEPEEAEAVERRTDADRELAEAARAAEEAARARRASEETRARAERALAHAREAAADATSRVERVEGQRRRLLEEEAAARAEATALAEEAIETAAAVRELPRVSESGRIPPGRTPPDLVAWADRVSAALVVVRGSLAAERERLLREAGELAAAALGEPLYGVSVAAVRRRLEES